MTLSPHQRKQVRPAKAGAFSVGVPQLLPPGRDLSLREAAVQATRVRARVWATFLRDEHIGAAVHTRLALVPRYRRRARLPLRWGQGWIASDKHRHRWRRVVGNRCRRNKKRRRSLVLLLPGHLRRHGLHRRRWLLVDLVVSIHPGPLHGSPGPLQGSELFRQNQRTCTEDGSQCTEDGSPRTAATVLRFQTYRRNNRCSSSSSIAKVLEYVHTHARVHCTSDRCRQRTRVFSTPKPDTKLGFFRLTIHVYSACTIYSSYSSIALRAFTMMVQHVRVRLVW